MQEESLVYRLRKRAEIRRQIKTRKSVKEGAPDRISDLLEEAANEIEKLIKGSENGNVHIFRNLFNTIFRRTGTGNGGTRK
jgi:hypothetical protein